MIRIEHLNLVVKNIPQSLRFYQAALPHWRVRGGGQDEWYSHPRQWVHFGDDYFFLTLNDNGQGDNRDLTSIQVGLGHFAFITEDLDGLIARLDAAGFTPHHSGAEDPARRNMYYRDPDGFEVEFVQYTSDIPALRNHYDSQVSPALMEQISQEGLNDEAS